MNKFDSKLLPEYTPFRVATTARRQALYFHFGVTMGEIARLDGVKWQSVKDSLSASKLIPWPQRRPEERYAALGAAWLVLQLSGESKFQRKAAEKTETVLSHVVDEADLIYALEAHGCTPDEIAVLLVPAKPVQLELVPKRRRRRKTT